MWLPDRVNIFLTPEASIDSTNASAPRFVLIDIVHSLKKQFDAEFSCSNKQSHDIHRGFDRQFNKD
jgi:hypothetical protein